MQMLEIKPAQASLGVLDTMILMPRLCWLGRDLLYWCCYCDSIQHLAEGMFHPQDLAKSKKELEDKVAKHPKNFTTLEISSHDTGNNDSLCARVPASSFSLSIIHAQPHVPESLQLRPWTLSCKRALSWLQKIVNPLTHHWEKSPRCQTAAERTSSFLPFFNIGTTPHSLLRTVPAVWVALCTV